MSEIAVQRSKLADKRRQYRELNFRAEAHVIELRNILDPYIDDYAALRMNLGRVEWLALESVHAEMAELKRQIEKMERDLDG